MRSCRSRVVAGLIAAALASGCASPFDRVDNLEDGVTDGPPPRTSWQLRHRVLESADLQVDGRGADAWQESTSVQVGRPGTRTQGCVVALPTPPYGGPDHWVGEQLPTQVRGRPAIRNGAGAEASYVLWQLDDGAWVEVSCDELEDRGPVDRVAAAVRLDRAGIPVPFGLTRLPAGYAVAGVQQSADSVQVHLGRIARRSGPVGPELEVFNGTEPRAREATGREVTVGGRPALLRDDPAHPSVCVLVQEQHVCVFPTLDDTRPSPDHAAEVPVLLEIAEALTFAPDLRDRSTWFAAHRVLG